MAIIDVVRFEGLKSRDWLIYKYPSENIVLGSQLIVNQSQEAVFIKIKRLATNMYGEKWETLNMY